VQGKIDRLSVDTLIEMLGVPEPVFRSWSRRAAEWREATERRDLQSRV
jgi:hypothetical protein